MKVADRSGAPWRDHWQQEVAEDASLCAHAKRRGQQTIARRHDRLLKKASNEHDIHAQPQCGELRPEHIARRSTCRGSAPASMAKKWHRRPGDPHRLTQACRQLRGCATEYACGSPARLPHDRRQHQRSPRRGSRCRIAREIVNTARPTFRSRALRYGRQRTGAYRYLEIRASDAAQPADPRAATRNTSQ